MTSSGRDRGGEEEGRQEAGGDEHRVEKVGEGRQASNK